MGCREKDFGIRTIVPGFNLDIRKQSSSGFKVVAPTAKIATVNKENDAPMSFLGEQVKNEIFRFRSHVGLNSEAFGAKPLVTPAVMRQPFSILGMNQKPNEPNSTQIGEKTNKEDDVNADLKLVVRDVKKKLTYDELEDQNANALGEA